MAPLRQAVVQVQTLQIVPLQTVPRYRERGRLQLEEPRTGLVNQRCLF